MSEKSYFRVWYAIKPTFKFNDKLTVENLPETHAFVCLVLAENMEEAFCKMQADSWSPKGEASSIIRRMGLKHTSMSVGDVLEGKNSYWQCDVAGWGIIPNK